MRGLAYRRHQRERAKCRAYRYFWLIMTFRPLEITARMIGRRATDRAPCSCHICGNPRRFFREMTWQERRAENFDEPRYLA